MMHDLPGVTPYKNISSTYPFFNGSLIRLEFFQTTAAPPPSLFVVINFLKK